MACKTIRKSIVLLATAVTYPLFAQTTAFGIDSHDPANVHFSTVLLPSASPISEVAELRGTVFAGDLGPDGLFYAVVNGDLVSIEPSDGAVTVINPVTGIAAGHTVVGMTYDPVIHIMFLVSTHLNNTGSRLYAINLRSAMSVTIGDITNSRYILAIALHCDGELYGFDDLEDRLVRIDPGSGAGKVIGPLEFDASSLPQSADFDFKSSTLYWTISNGAGGELRTVNINTGESTRVTAWRAAFVAFGISGDCSVTGVQEDAVFLPEKPQLLQNYPNPFNPFTTIRFSLDSERQITITVSNITGQRVRMLAEGTYPAGHHSVGWDGRDENGRALPTGLYVVRLSGRDFTLHRKLLLIK